MVAKVGVDVYHSGIKGIEYYLPEHEEQNDPIERLTAKIGINSRRIAMPNEFASDLACRAIDKLFRTLDINPNEVDFLLYCTQSPDYFLPSTSCLIQNRVGLPTSCGALDMNLGCSGFVYGLALAKGLIEAGTARNIILVTSDTYSKFINPRDKSVKVLFGDGAAATLVSRMDGPNSHIGPFEFGTDGKGAENLIVPAGGLREPSTGESAIEYEDEKGNIRSRANLYMNGSEIYNFAIKEVSHCVQSFLDTHGETIEDYDYFVFHQANAYMLEALRRKLCIPQEKFSVQLNDCGNTVSSSIPIALCREAENGQIPHGSRIMLVGFGVGYSWAVCSIKWQ